MPTEVVTNNGTAVATYVKRQFGDESGVQITDSDILAWVNIAQREIAINSNFSKVVAKADMVAGQAEYTFPDIDILQTQTIYANGKQVKYLSFQEYQEYVQKKEHPIQEAEQPEVWFEYGGTFTLWPTPTVNATAGITIYFVTNPKPLSTLSDMLAVPDRLYHLFLKRVLKHAYTLDENFDAASMLENEVSGQESQIINYNEEAATNEYYAIVQLSEEEAWGHGR